MFFPSLKFLCELKNKHGIMWERIYGLPERIPGLFSESPLADMPYPNANDDVSFQFWVKYSDWYTMPHIQLFDSFDHLMYLLTKANFYEISKNMKQYNSLEEERLVQQWKDIFSKF